MLAAMQRLCLVFLKSVQTSRRKEGKAAVFLKEMEHTEAVWIYIPSAHISVCLSYQGMSQNSKQ